MSCRNSAAFLIVFALVFLALPAQVLAKDNPIAKQRLEVATPFGLFIFENLSFMRADGIGVVDGVLTGNVTNNTTRKWTQAKFRISLLDKNGKELTEARLPANFSLFGLLKGQSVAMTHSEYGVDKGEKPGAAVSAPGFRAWNRVKDFAITFDPTSNFAAAYKFSMVKPSSSENMVLSDEFLKISFNPSDEQIAFVIENHTDNPISIQWDEGAYIDPDGTSHRIIHKGIKLADRENPQTPTTVPPGAKAADFLYPSDYVSFVSSITEWSERPLLPDPQTAKGVEGKTIGVFLPMIVNGSKKNYSATFRVDGVVF